MKKVELLSPAGDFECLKAAINNGADAVYIGGTSFSARNFAKNFTLEEIKEAVRYAHLRNAKIYIAINTLLNDKEIDEAYELVKKYYEYNVDALIIQDLGLFYRIRKDFPDFELHASTQMHIHNVKGIINAKKLGFNRVIVPRESSLDNLKEFCKHDIDIECFVHGAICISYSGQCLMSSFTKDRSANRGECAQCCRLKYYYSDNKRIIKSKTEYLLSTKDMMLLKQIPDLIGAGVSSFKIEGRLKSPSYVAYVTRIYREAIDSYYDNKTYNLTKDSFIKLKTIFNREYTDYYLIRDEYDLLNNNRPNHIGVEVGHVIKQNGSFVDVKLKNDLKLHDSIRILNKNIDYGTEIFELFQNNAKTEFAKTGSIVTLKAKGSFEYGDVVLKTGDKDLESKILNYDLVKNCINLKTIIKPNQNIVVECTIDDSKFIFKSDVLAEVAKNYPLDIKTIIDCFNKTDEHPYLINNFDIEYSDCYINIKTLNEVRRAFYNQLDSNILNKFNRHLNEYHAVSNNSLDVISNSIDHLKLDRNSISPIVNNESEYSKYEVISDFGGLFENKKVSNYSLSVYNSYAYEFLLKLGFEKIILSVELKNNDIDYLIQSFYKRNNISIRPYVITKGSISLMNIFGNPFDTKYHVITDKKNTYDIIRHDSYTSLSTNIERYNDIKYSNVFNDVIIK